MSTNWLVFLDRRAEEDIDSAAQWYAEERLELALEFLNAVDAAFDLIAQFPQAYQEVAPGIRRVLTRKFPFCVYYTIDDKRLTVFAVLHASRSSETWQQRLD
ncbi:type II toxin-antitoxin system RelE/ParE family toxin [Microcystis aeruginosa LEGE 00239]|uniref:type II toxin-antitoxin system RelE/ParE family toxin n=1 Tax=Microcystis aeruginosa TaxID=1126 RepID=UPI00187E75D3|nr:type II toxin-antitoxin system RelE/ParE family toxin [Microcystis aeruginosa]MBE9246551.1 type II toxin-antitoxin system RelE/ParE family toxin [Microcystis aeruginosa LEGE 00239]